MKFKDQVIHIRRNMKKNRLRLFMTVLATAMGCAFLIVLASIGFGFQKSAEDEIAKQMVLTQANIMGKQVNGKEQEIGPEDLKEMESIDGVKAVVHRLPVSGELSMEGRKSIEVQPYLTDLKEEQKSDLQLEAGRLPKAENEVLAGYHLAGTLLTAEERKQFEKNMNGEDVALPKGFSESLIGKTVSLNVQGKGKQETESQDFKIVGIVKKPSLEYARDTTLLISEAYKEKLEGITGSKYSHYDPLRAYAVSIDKVENISNALKEKGYLVDSVSERIKGMSVFFNALKIGLIFVGAVAVLIASIGIFNTMTMAVSERTQEIGIMKAVGAQPAVIKRLFLLESAWIGVIGSVIGILVSYLISIAANTVIPMILSSTAGGGRFDMTFSYIPPSLVAISAAISIGVAILSGLRPAAKATRISVLSALRREA
ncbi:FtsX-like permease family protein [Metabacillus sp. GX 13764]|nr:FtsX-like permease family protein [Metabacillus kandeliae]MCD7032672.1 FtsX-like permease family protein [Metabacillus kandeliae]